MRSEEPRMDQAAAFGKVGARGFEMKASDCVALREGDKAGLATASQAAAGRGLVSCR